MIKNIFFKNGKEYLRISKKNWNNYLNIVSPYRKSDNNILECSLRDKNSFWCNTCNVGIGSFTNSCVNIISSINLQKYENILNDINDSDENIEFYVIKIDRNDNNSTI